MTVKRLTSEMDISEMYEWMALAEIEANKPKDEREELIQRAETSVKEIRKRK